MTAKEYLEQPMNLDMRIKSKAMQVASLRSLAERSTATLSAASCSGTGSRGMERFVLIIAGLEKEIEQDTVRMTSLMEEISLAINSVDDCNQRTLLHLRYICFLSWEDIAEELGLSVSFVYKLHRRALSNLTVPSQALS